MTEEKKPRKVKDLKARLGKTISPQGAGLGAMPAPAVGQAKGGVVPPPTVGGGGPGGGTSPGAVPAPPFARPGAAPKKPSAPDPFAAAAASPAGPQEVRIVIDEKPVADSEVGRRRRGLSFILVGVGLVIGLVVGGFAGNSVTDRRLYNLAVRDGKDIYQAVRTASEAVNKARTYVDSAVGRARGGPGRTPAVDFQAIEALQALEKPLSANAFARKRYSAFRADTVDALFEYYNNVQLLWDKFERLANRSLPAARRRALTESAERAQNVATPSGCIPAVVEDRFVCGLVFWEPMPAPAEGTPEAEGPTKVMARSNLRGQPFEKILFQGTETDLLETPDQYMILVHPQRSAGVLGASASEFAQYVADLSDIKGLLDRTAELQGRLERDLGEIARLEEIFEL